MTRLFISHSSKDNVSAKAFKQWLGANGWPDEDVFLDVDDIDAGERWKDALRNANLRCEAIILLASPEALSSPECLAEIRKAEDYGKEIVVVLLRDVQLDDRRLDAYKERQIVDLMAAPLSHSERVQYRGEEHEIQFNKKALEKIRDYLIKRGITPDYFAWPPAGNPMADPFPGLSPFTEEDAGIFFGRDADILRGLDKLRITRRNDRPRTFVIQAASGAGKSSYLRAGLWPRLDRDPDFAPVAIVRPAKGILTGPNGLGRALAARLSRPDRPVNPGDIHAQLVAPIAEEAIANFRKLMAEVSSRAHEQRRVGDHGAHVPALILAVDQAEELFASEDAEESGRFIHLLSNLLLDPPAGVEPFAIFTIRADNATQLFQILIDRKLEVSETVPLMPLPRTSYRDVILKPLDVLARRGKKLTITAELVERLVDDSAGADALPLLAFSLSNLYKDFSAAGTIGLEQYETMGGVAGSIELALKRALSDPRSSPVIPSDKNAQLACLRNTFLPWLARISPETGLPIRRVARLDEFSADQLAVVERLISARLLVADQREGANVVEVAHESLLRQWPDLTGWLEQDAESLKVVESVERAASEWARDDNHSPDRLEHRATRLRMAERIAKREDLSKRLGEQGLAYLAACRASERSRALRFGSIVAGLLILLAIGGLAWRYEAALVEMAYWFGNVRPYVLTASQDQDLKPLDHFKECSDCPEMVALPAGTFVMGAKGVEKEGDGREYPAHEVAISTDIAIAETPVTFAQFTACAEHGGCDPEIGSNTHDDRPAVNVTWSDANRYIDWLSRITGKSYRLLSEAEYEYAARGGTMTRFPWGDQAGKGNANCGDCASGTSRRGTTPVASFPANGFGLYDAVGNVFQWVNDCFHENYTGAPADGSVWDEEGCTRRVVRGASWLSRSGLLRSSWRDWSEATARKSDIGFRVARSLDR